VSNYYTDEQKRHRKISRSHGHIGTLQKGTASLTIPKRTIKKVKGFSKLTRIQNVRQAYYAHAIVHSPRYQKSHSPEQVKREHAFLVEHYLPENKTPM
jgi:hypothetical protein